MVENLMVEHFEFITKGIKHVLVYLLYFRPSLY